MRPTPAAGRRGARRGLAGAAAGFAVAGVLALVFAFGPLGPAEGPGAATVPGGSAPIAPTSPPSPTATAAAAEPAASAERSLATLQAWWREASSLRGSEPDGDWGFDAAGQLQPTRGLRRRFDFWLTLVGEATPAELGRLMRADAEAALRQHGHAAAVVQAGVQQVEAVWQAYLQLFGRRWAHAVVPHDPATWAAALAEQQAARRAALGPAWAEAFNGEEEAQLLAALRRHESTPGAPPEAPARATAAPPLIDRDRLDTAARARLDAELARQQAWETALADARAEQQRLAADPQLSPLLRREALDRWIASRFDAAEQGRVRVLLELP